MSQNYLWKDGTHFEDKGTDISAVNFVDFLNYFVLNRNHVTNNRIWLFGIHVQKNYKVHEIIYNMIKFYLSRAFRNLSRYQEELLTTLC